VRPKLRCWNIFWRDERGVDLVEYTLLLAFVCLASAALFIGVGKTITGIWGYTSSTMQQAYCAASASS
jgi:Flp pilus assembly pilin Flp